MCELVERRETCEKCRSVAGVQTELDPCESAMQSGENCANTRKTSENKYVPKSKCSSCFFEELEKKREKEKRMATIKEDDNEQ